MGENNQLEITNFKLGIGLPLSFPMVPADFFESFMLMEKGEYVLLRSKDGPIDMLRNGLVGLALAAGCTHLVMLDTDMYYDIKTIPKLLSHERDVVGALYFRRCPPFEPFMVKNNEYILEWEEGDLIEVDRTAGGCILFNMKVFDKIDPPWFEVEKTENGMIKLGEDYNFCDKLRNAGYKIYVDTSIVAEHLSAMRVNTRWFKLWRKLTEENHK